MQYKSTIESRELLNNYYLIFLPCTKFIGLQSHNVSQWLVHVTDPFQCVLKNWQFMGMDIIFNSVYVLGIVEQPQLLFK